MENLQASWNHACRAEGLAARCRGYCGHAAKSANQSKASFTLAQQSRGTAKAFAQVAEFHAGKAAGHEQATDTHRMSAFVSAYEADGSAKTVATQLDSVTGLMAVATQLNDTLLDTVAFSRPELDGELKPPITHAPEAPKRRRISIKTSPTVSARTADAESGSLFSD